MNRTPASLLRPIAASVFVMMAFGACKTVRTSEKWGKVSVGTSKYEKRMDKTVRDTYNQLEALAAGDESADYTHSQYDKKTSVDTENNLFGKKSAKVANKDFRTKDFAGADEYKRDEYHFLKRQNFDAETSSDEGKLFNTKTSSDERRRFFGRNKRARTKDYADSDKRARTGGYRETDSELRRLENRRPNIVKDDASDAGATMTVDDVRTLLNGN